MKKLISSIIIIMPLLLLAILLVSGAIVSLLTHIYVEKIEFSNNETLYLVMDDEQNPPTYNLGDEVTVLPLKATERGLIFNSGDESVATVTPDGEISASFYGETYITVTSKENAAATATRKVVVTDNSVHALKLNDYAKDMYQGETAQLSVAVYPQQAENKAINWSSSDESILQVSSNGTVTSLGNGTATVTATSVDNPSVQVTATINCHAKLKSLVFDNSLFQTSRTTAQFPAVTSDPAECDFTLQYACDNTDVADVDQNGNITFKKEGKVTVTVTGTDYKGNAVQGQKTFVSTFGYFVGPLFDAKSIKYADCQVGEALPLNFVPKLEGSYQLIKTIEYAIDDTVTSGEGQTGLIEYDETNKQFVLKQDFPEFNGFIEVVVHATVYDNATNTLNATYEDNFYIVKQEIQQNSKAYHDGNELTAGDASNDILLDDIGATATITIENPDNLRVQINSTQNVTAVRDGNTVTLTGKLVCEGEVIQLSIGTKIYNLRVTVHAKAQRIEVFFGGAPISSGERYSTLLNELIFTVQSARDDKQHVANPVMYQLNGAGEWKQVSDGTLTLSVASSTTVKFTCDGKEFTLNLSKIALSDFGLEALYTKSDGAQQSLSALESVSGHDSWSLTLPSDIQNTVTFQLKVANLRQYLGGFGTDDYFKTLFPIDLPADDGWSVNHNATVGQIVVSTPSDFNKTLKLGYNDGANEISIHLFKVNIQAISFGNGDESYDSNNSDDVHKGYQQVRVFAKHSYYDGKQVDYFRIPLNALSNVALQTPASVDTISWTLSRYVGTASTKVLVTQLGDTVTIDSQVYKIVPQNGEYVLQDANGTVVSGENGLNNDGYIWVDAYTEKEQGYARIYFGNFKGLREVDVQNDYFGNFDDKPTWTKPQQVVDDNSGRAFDVSAENSFTFLRVEAGDGVEGGKNCHFNFNVLDDATLVNVFDAAGYYANSNLVLHSDLYGPGELKDDPSKESDAQQKGLFLDEPNNLGKTLLYGNGYQINLERRHQDIPDKTYNNSATVKFEMLYNVIVKGCNPVPKVNMLTVRQYIVLKGAYYCDIQYYTKLYSNYSTGTEYSSKYGYMELKKMYLKNTVLRNCSQQAVLVYADYTREGASITAIDKFDLYLENIVETDCLLGFNAMGVAWLQKVLYYNIWIKGDFDCLDYDSVNNFMDKSSNFVEFGVKDTIEKNVNLVNDWLEWFGQSRNVTDFANSFFNPVITGLVNGVMVGVNCWDGTEYKQLDINDLDPFTYYGMPNTWYKRPLQKLANGLEIQRIASIDPYAAGMTIYSYSDQASKDSGVTGDTGDRDWEKLFTRDRYIRLLCQYMSADANGNLTRNNAHLLWHMQKVYRDLSLINGREEDHIKALVDSLKGVTWADGSGIDANGNIFDKTKQIVVKYEDIIGTAQPQQ